MRRRRQKGQVMSAGTSTSTPGGGQLRATNSHLAPRDGNLKLSAQPDALNHPGDEWGDINELTNVYRLQRSRVGWTADR